MERNNYLAANSITSPPRLLVTFILLPRCFPKSHHKYAWYERHETSHENSYGFWKSTSTNGLPHTTQTKDHYPNPCYDMSHFSCYVHTSNLLRNSLWLGKSVWLSWDILSKSGAPSFCHVRKVYIVVLPATCHQNFVS